MTGFLSNSATGVQQTVATNIGTAYDLSFWVGNISNPGGGYGTDSTVEVFIGGVSQGSFTNSSGFPGHTQTWEQFTLGFTASTTSTLIEFLNRDQMGWITSFYCLMARHPQPCLNQVP